MAIEYYLICPACKEFIDLYKIRLVKLPAGDYKLPAEGIELSEEDLLKGIERVEQELAEIQVWIRNLLPFVKIFVQQHAAHRLILKDDYPAPAWYPESPGYTAWKEYRSTHSHELFLPRNLVDDLQITSWAEAEKHLRVQNVILYEELELDEYRETFEKLMQNHRST